jgi:hypothetical protein
MWQLLFTLFLVGMVVEAGREAYGVRVGWASKHFTRMTTFTRTFRPPRDFWTERKTPRERRIHQKRFHIDLLERPRVKKRLP